MYVLEKNNIKSWNDGFTVRVLLNVEELVLLY